MGWRGRVAFPPPGVHPGVVSCYYYGAGCPSRLSRDTMYMCMHMRMQGVRDEWRAHAHVPMSICMHMHMQGVRDEWRAQLAGVEAEVSRLGLAKAEQSHVDRALDEKVCACACACACA